MRKTMTLSIILAAALGCSALALAQGPAGGPGGFHGHHGGGFDQFRGLNLTDAQKTQVKQIHQQTFSSLKSQFQTVRQDRQALEALAPNASGYQAAAAKLAQDEGSLTTARITAEAAATTQIYSTVLTGTQQTQYTTNKAAFQARMQEWQQFKAAHPLPSSSTSSSQQ